MASLIKGKTIILYDRIQVGVDAFNHPVYQETPVSVENVLITPVDTKDITGDYQRHGKRQVYELSIPKKNTNVWENREVEFYGKRWQTIGFPQDLIEENVPLDWNRKVRVERYG